MTRPLDTIEFVTPPVPDTPPATYSDAELIEIIEWDCGDVEQLIAEALGEEESVGACSNCGTVYSHVVMDAKNEFCESCGDFAVFSVCALAGVL